MEITAIRIKLINRPNDRLKAVCSLVLDNDFLVRDIKIVANLPGLMVTMPSRMITDHCPKCRSKNPILSKFCGQCGVKLAEKRAPVDEFGRFLVFTNIAHPISLKCRDLINQKVLEAYETEMKKPGRSDSQPAEINTRRPEYNDRAAGA